MSETLEYIDDYFNQVLNPEQRKQFEERCSTDNSFAEEVAFYVMTRGAAREALLEEKQKQWKSTEATVQKLYLDKPVKKSFILRFAPYAAAACLLFVLAFYFLFTRQTPQSIAANYLKENYSDIKHYMDASKDSLQLGISAYNDKNYKRALVLFTSVKQKDSASYDAKKFTGLTYLQLKDYDKALLCFKELSALKTPYNAGDILQASTLLQRNATGDEEAAKSLLQKVVHEKEEGNIKAQEILDKGYEKYH